MSDTSLLTYYIKHTYLPQTIRLGERLVRHILEMSRDCVWTPPIRVVLDLGGHEAGWCVAVGHLASPKLVSIRNETSQDAEGFATMSTKSHDMPACSP